MLKYICMFLYTSIMTFSVIYTWHKLLNKNLNIKNYKLYLSVIGITIITMLNILTVNKFLRIVVITIIMMMFFRFLFQEKIHKCIVTPIFSQLLTMISEGIFAIIIILLNFDINETLDSFAINMLSNILIAIILSLLVRIKLLRILYKKILEITDKISQMQLITFSMIAMIIANILAMSIYYKIDFIYLLVFNISMILICFFIMFYSLKTQNKYNKVSDKYNIAIKSLNDYEDMMTKYRVANHENKNLLLTVRAMVLNKDKDIPKYIDSIIEQKYMDDEKLLFEMSVIPSGGLRATIYSEILKIKENKINYSLNIDRKINTVDLINLETDTIVEICKIIGVFIDNSIEAVKTLRKKTIDIQLYIEDKNLCIKVSNNYKGNIDISKINDEGYTTKGKGHGYGLSLVKNIVNNNDLFENRTEISKTIFSQILIIKYKKTH